MRGSIQFSGKPSNQTGAGIKFPNGWTPYDEAVGLGLEELVVFVLHGYQTKLDKFKSRAGGSDAPTLGGGERFIWQDYPTSGREVEGSGGKMDQRGPKRD
jgi:hypothetical protein